MTRNRAATPALVLLFLALAATGYWMIFSNFAVYDDEGYILMSAREYLAHGGLYEAVYSQYGPAFHTLADLFQRVIGSPVDHTSARLLTLGLWLATAAACAAMVRQLTGSFSLTAFTLAGTFLYLYFLPDEPFHPGASILFILAVSLQAIGALLRADRGRAAAVVAGAAGALLLLTKINVGVFYFGGVGGWALLHAGSERVRRIAAAFMGILFLVLALLLMKALWHEPWVRIYLALFGAGAFTVVGALSGSAVVTVRQAACFVVAAGLVTAATLTLVGLRGTSVSGLLDGVLLGPLRHPMNYSYPVDWRPGALTAGGASLLLALALPWIRRRHSPELADQIVVTLRLLQAVALLVGLALLMHLRVVGAVFTYVAPLIWTWVVPLAGADEPRTTRLSRGLLATILLLQYLHAYPVGGSQVSWATFLFFPLVALGLGEVRRWHAGRRAASGSRSGWWPAIATLLVAVPVAKTAWTAFTMKERYAQAAGLGLPGADALHLPDNLRTAYRIVALNAVVHADMLFSLPGMFSFNLWTGLPTPTQKNTTLWFTLLNDEDQRAIIQALEKSERPALIVQESLIAVMQNSGVSIQGVLHDYLLQNFSPAFRVEGFAFLVRKGRSIAPLNVARLTLQPPTADGTPDTTLEFNLASDGTPIAGIEVRDMMGSRRGATYLTAANANVAVTAIDSAERAMDSPSPAAWPLNVKGLSRVSVQFNRTGISLDTLTTVFRLQGSAAQDLVEIRIAE